MIELHLIDYIILGIIGALLGRIIYKKIKQGKSGLCCGCSGCEMKEQCGKRNSR